MQMIIFTLFKKGQMLILSTTYPGTTEEIFFKELTKEFN